MAPISFGGMEKVDNSTSKFMEYDGTNGDSFFNSDWPSSSLPGTNLVGGYGNTEVNVRANIVELPSWTLVLLGRHPGWTMPAWEEMCDGSCPLSSWKRECTGHYGGQGQDCNNYELNSLFSMVFEPGTYELDTQSAMYLFLPPGNIFYHFTG